MAYSKKKLLGTIWAIAGLAFLLWMIVSMNVHEVDDAVFEDSADLEVAVTEDFVAYSPRKSAQKVLFFYPGALVDPAAYAPLARQIAERGHRVFIVRMPFRLATRGYEKIKNLGLLEDSTKTYILMGHSQGAKMAAQFVHENPGLVDKLILLGTTHPRDVDLSASDIPILKISGSHDGVADFHKVEQNKAKLPPSTKYVLVEGGNHSQFGYYGFQLGDSRAAISREQQQAVVLENVLAFIE